MLKEPEIGILIADDHSIFRDGLRRLLEAEPGFCVIGEATNGEETLALTKELQPDVLLLDDPLRGLDGFARLEQIEVLRELHRLGSTMEFAGYDTSLNRRRLDLLKEAARACCIYFSPPGK